MSHKSDLSVDKLSRKCYTICVISQKNKNQEERKINLTEISNQYIDDAAALKQVIEKLLAESETCGDARLAEIKVQLVQLNNARWQALDLAEITSRYYERGYCKSGKYCF